ncbi:uncharacterized protein LOC134555512 isoform X2 [Prinia subflava]|uniref:uncharacterized protein LOC134555512 isoform X2 n=1 Tax=Prinia subflava TaxID=208062 RepID=UPI002FE1C47D
MLLKCRDWSVDVFEPQSRSSNAFLLKKGDRLLEDAPSCLVGNIRAGSAPIPDVWHHAGSCSGLEFPFCRSQWMVLTSDIFWKYLGCSSVRDKDLRMTMERLGEGSCLSPASPLWAATLKALPMLFLHPGHCLHTQPEELQPSTAHCPDVSPQRAEVFSSQVNLSPCTTAWARCQLLHGKEPEG